jgi:excinuclease ABC subunit A
LTRAHLFEAPKRAFDDSRKPTGWIKLMGVTRHNVKDLDIQFPVGLLTVVTGISGSGKTTLVSQVLAETTRARLGIKEGEEDEESDEEEEEEVAGDLSRNCAAVEGMELIQRLVCVDQKPIGRTPRSNLATYTGLFDFIRKRFAATDEAKKRGYNAGRFSFNVAGGRCTVCDGEGFVSVELLFLPSVYAPCSGCHGTRYNAETLAITYRELNIAQVLDMTVDSANHFFKELPAVARALQTLKDVGLGYLRLGQPATELSGGEAQRIKLATELQRVQTGSTLYLLDEPTTGLHPADIEKLMYLLRALVDNGNTVIVVEHDMDVVTRADCVIDLGPGAGPDGGRIVAQGGPAEIARSATSRTAPYLKHKLERFGRNP